MYTRTQAHRKKLHGFSFKFHIFVEKKRRRENRIGHETLETVSVSYSVANKSRRAKTYRCRRGGLDGIQ